MENLTGRKFGRLTVISFVDQDKYYNKKWLCRCDCGNEKTIFENALRSGATRSCGCYFREATSKRMSQGFSKIFTKEYLIENHVKTKISLREIARQAGCTVSCVMQYMEKFNIPANDQVYDIVGKKFGKLTVISLSHTPKNGSYWNVECECGVKKVVQGACLIKGDTTSCGCYANSKKLRVCGELSGRYWEQVKYGAKKRNFEFNIEMEYAWELFLNQDGKCALSGREIILDKYYSSAKDKGIQTASLDRIDSNKGYLDGNIQWVHKIVNRIKNKLPEDRFLFLCEKIVDHNLT